MTNTTSTAAVERVMGGPCRLANTLWCATHQRMPRYCEEAREDITEAVNAAREEGRAAGRVEALKEAGERFVKGDVTPVADMLREESENG